MGNQCTQRSKKRNKQISLPKFGRKNCFNQFLGVIDDVSEYTSTTSSSSSSSSLDEYIVEEKTVEDALEEDVLNNRLFIVSKSSCKFCSKLLNILSDYGVNRKHFLVKDIDTDLNQEEILKHLCMQTGRINPPYVFMNGNYIGGYNKVLNLHKQNQLQALLSKESVLLTAMDKKFQEASIGQEISLDSRFSNSRILSDETSSISNFTMTSRKGSSDVKKNQNIAKSVNFQLGINQQKSTIPLPPPLPENRADSKFMAPPKLHIKSLRSPIAIQENSNKEYVTELKEALQKKYGNSPNVRSIQK